MRLCTVLYTLYIENLVVDCIQDICILGTLYIVLKYCVLLAQEQQLAWEENQNLHRRPSDHT